jgi:hypothetical protein
MAQFARYHEAAAAAATEVTLSLNSSTEVPTQERRDRTQDTQTSSSMEVAKTAIEL